MFGRINLNKFENSIGGAAIIIAVFSVLTKILGLWRDRLLASSFGASETLDAYLAAFRLPDLVFNTLILGAFSSAFIPVFLAYWRKDKAEAWRIVNSTLNILFAVIFVLSILIIIFAPWLVRLIVPGLSYYAQSLTIKLTRIISLSILFFTLSNVISSVLNSFHKFLAYSLAPLMYNLGIIFGILFLVKTNLGVSGLAWGVVLGSFLHLIVQLPSLFKTGFVWRPLFSLSAGVKEIFLLMTPRFLGLAINQVNVLTTTAIASFVASGAIAIYYLAFNLASVPVGLIGVPLAISVFPVLSQSYAAKDEQVFASKLSKTTRQIFYFILPLTVIFFLFRKEIIEIILQTGLFTKKDSFLAAQTLGFFSLSLFAQSLIPLLARAFYAQHNTKTPVYAAVLSLIINILGCLVFGKTLGVSGLGLAFTLSSFVNFFLLYFLLKGHGLGFQKRDVYPILKFLLLSFLTGLLIIFLKFFLASMPNLMKTAIIILAAISFYYFLSLIYKIEEAKKLKDFLKFFQ